MFTIFYIFSNYLPGVPDLEVVLDALGVIAAVEAVAEAGHVIAAMRKVEAEAPVEVVVEAAAEKTVALETTNHVAGVVVWYVVENQEVEANQFQEVNLDLFHVLVVDHQQSVMVIDLIRMIDINHLIEMIDT